MAKETATPVEAPRAVVCGSCGCGFDLSARNVRAARARGEKPRCRPCRGLDRLTPPAPHEMARLRRWWLERFTLAELQAIAGAIWPDA